MPSRAFTLSKTRLQSNKLTRTLRQNFSAQPDVRSAAVMGNKLIAVGGSLYDSTVGGDNIGEAVAVVNVGRPAAAVYAPSSGGAAVVSVSTGGGGSGGGATSFAQLSGTISDAQAPQFLKTDGSRALLGNLAVTDGVTIDGVDISAHAANPNAHHNWQHNMLSTADHVYSGGNALDVFGLTAPSTIGVLTPSANPGAASAILKSDSLGNLTLESLTTPLLKAVGHLTINPVGDVLFPDDQWIRTVDFNSEFPIQGFAFYPILDQITELPTGKSGLTVGVVVADEIHTKIFVADETRVDRGELWISKSFGIVSAAFTTPSAINGTVTIDFEDSPALNGAIFSSGDYLLFRILDESSGLDIAQAWGTVSSYHDYDADDPVVKPNQQSWVFTLKSGATSYDFPKSSFAVDFGQSGQGVIQETVQDPAGSPYIRIASWATNPYNPSNYTTHVRLGKLFSSDDNDLSPTGYGLFADNVYLKGDFLTGNGDIRMYQASGLNFQQGSNEVFASLVDRRAIQWWDDVANIGVADTPSFNIGASLPTSGGYAGVNMAGIELFPTNGQQAILFQIVHGAGVDNTAQIYMQGRSSGGTAPLIRLSAPDLVLDGTTTADNIIPSNVNTPNDIGTNSNRFDTIYANNIIAGTLTADTSIGATLSGAIWQNDASNMTIESDSSSNRVLYVTNPGAGKMDLNVDNDIILGGLVDGVDVSAFKAAYDGHTHAHSALTGLTSGDNHTQYVHISTARTITVQHAFSPGTAQAPFTLGANAQGQTVTGLKADQLNKSVSAGSGLTGGGALTGNVTLDLLWGTPTISTIIPDAAQSAGTSANPARSDHTHAIVAAAPAANLTVSTSNAEGTATSFARSDHSHAITANSNPGAAASILASTSAGGLTLQSLNIGTVGNISTAGVVTMADDVDTVHKFGRTALGHASYNDFAAFSHRDMTAAGQYGAMQDNLGNLFLNTTTGNIIYHRVNNADVLQMSSQRLNPTGSGQIDLGDYNRKYRTLFASELYVEVLVAQSVMATIGGRIMVAPTTKLIADVNAYQNYIDVKDTSLFNADYVRFETAPGGVPQVETMRLTSTPTAITGGYRHTVLRKVDTAPIATLIAAITSTSATTMDVSTNTLANGNYVYLMASTKVPPTETVQIASGPTTITGGYRYTIVRNVNGTGALTWALGSNVNYTYRSWTSGDAVVSLGGGSGTQATTIANITTGATTIDVNSSSLTIGGNYFFWTGTQYEPITVTAGPTTITGGYRYTVTRNVAGLGAKAWTTGSTLHAVSQQTGTGYIDLTSTSTIHNHLGPTIAIYNRTSSANWNDVKPVTALGNLRSFVDYTSNTFGWGVGNDLTLSPTGGFSGMTGDAVNGLRQFNTITKMYQSGAEALRIAPTDGIIIATGNAAYNRIRWKQNITDVANIFDIHASGDNTSSTGILTTTAATGSEYTEITTFAQGTVQSSINLAVFGALGSNSVLVANQYTRLGDTNFTKTYNNLADVSFSEISSDRGTYQQLMLLGNKSGGGGIRRVGVWDRLQVGGATFQQALNVNGAIVLTDMSAPSTPTGGGVIYVQSGSLKFKGSSGTVTTLAPA